MADLYDQMTPQGASDFRAKLSSVVDKGACSGIDLSGGTSPTALMDAGNRFMAIACFQQAHNLPAASGAGVLDARTYEAIMTAKGHASPWLWVGIGLLVMVAVSWDYESKRRRR